MIKRIKSFIRTKGIFKCLKLFCRYVWEYFWGHIVAFFMYDKRVLRGKCFRGKHHGFSNPGWHWAVIDFNTRFFLGVNRDIRFPISPNNSVTNPENIHFDPDDLRIFQGKGKYFQAIGASITIGKGTFIANNVGIITTNHDKSDLTQHTAGKEIIIGKECWIGFNSVILPGVVLGDNVVVGAGSIVTKSFPEGHCTIVGNPARMIKSDNAASSIKEEA